jgi:hypothetical protein
MKPSNDWNPPWWWTHVQAARYLKVSPWSLDAVPSFWRDAALLCQNIEAEAAEAKAKK